ncbi:hypothetical protein ACLB1E_27100 [Escherichia coli]
MRNSALTWFPRGKPYRSCAPSRISVRSASPMAHPIPPDMVIEMNNFYTLTVLPERHRK